MSPGYASRPGAGASAGTIGGRRGLLGKVIVNAKGVHTLVHEAFGNGATSIWSQVLQGRGVRGRRDHDDGVIHRAIGPLGLDQLGNRRFFLPDRDINADDIATLLVEDGVDGDGRFTVLRSPMISSRCPRPIGIIASIALIPVWRGSSTGCLWAIPGREFPPATLAGDNRALAVNRISEGSTTRHHRLTDGNLQQATVATTSSPSSVRGNHRE